MYESLAVKGVEGYYNKQWPGGEKCKECNLAYFYDKWGHYNYVGSPGLHLSVSKKPI